MPGSVKLGKARSQQQLQELLGKAAKIAPTVPHQIGNGESSVVSTPDDSSSPSPSLHKARKIERAPHRDHVGETIHEGISTKCSFFGLVEIPVKDMRNAGVLKVECPGCLAMRGLTPKGKWCSFLSMTNERLEHHIVKCGGSKAGVCGRSPTKDVRMTNKETDELEFVRVESHGEMLGRVLTAVEGFSLEVFRDHQHIGSVNQKNGLSRLVLRPGDTLLRVTLGVRLLSLSGLLRSQEDYTFQYGATLRLRVDNPKQFALSYIQQSDPVYLARAIIEHDLQHYASHYTYGVLDPDSLQYCAGSALNVESRKMTGLRITSSHFLLDPIPTQLKEIEEQRLQTRVVKIFYCYAHEDRNLRDQLDKHMEFLRRSGKIVTWHDREILAGAEWKYEIDKHLKTSQIILLLVSPDFIKSDYCYGVKMQKALLMHRMSTARVIPIILRSVNWQETPIGKLQALPLGGKPVTAWRNCDEVLQSIIEEIQKVIHRFFQRNDDTEPTDTVI